MQRRAENAKAAEERCRRLVEAIDIVTDYRRHLDGEVLDKRAPSRSEVKAVYANIKEDLRAVCGKVDKEARRMIDHEYVHEPQTYRPVRRVSHTARCTCECCYLEDEAKKELVKKDLSEILSSPDSPRLLAMSYESAPELHSLEFHMDLENVSAGTNGRHNHVQSSSPTVIRRRSPRRVTWMDESTGDEEQRGTSESAIAVQTDDVMCRRCNAPANINRVGWTPLEKKDASSQTELGLFACSCCKHHLA